MSESHDVAFRWLAPKPNAKPLTDAQSACLHELRAHFVAHGNPPTYRELAAALGISSTNAAADRVRVLAKRGFVRIPKGSKSRGFVLVEPGVVS